MEVGLLYRKDVAFSVLKLVEDLVREEHVPLLPVLRYKESGLLKRAEWEQTWVLQREEDKLESQVRSELDGLLKPNAKGKLGLSSDACPKNSLAAIAFGLDGQGEQQGMTNVWMEMDAIVRKVLTAKIGPVPVPPKYTSADFISTGGVKYWKLRGKLDVNDIDEEFDLRMDEYFERFVSSQAAARGLSIDNIRAWKP